MSNKRDGILVYAVLLVAAFSFRATIARVLATDELDDGKVYSQIARNLLEQHTYSAEIEPPYVSSLIRLPGYPLFIAAVYSVFGHADNMGIRIVQALLDTATCALIALLAFFWEPDEKFKRRSSIAALALAAVCPFTTIYVATILTETPTIFLAVAMCLTATLAFKSSGQGRSLPLWAATGALAGIAVLFRPDSGLFALAIGITLVVVILLRAGDVKLNRKREEVLYRFSRASYLGAVFSLAFCLVLVPWTVRNYRVFHIFQPLAPAHAEMPGEFVPRGYLSWLRTWIDDGRFIGPVLWSLDQSPIKLDAIPDRAFDSEEEKQKVAALFDRYNHPVEQLDPFVPEFDPGPEPTPSEDEPDQNPDEPVKAGDQPSPDDQGDEAGEPGTGDEADAADENAAGTQATEQPVEMTPEIDAGFAQIAKERVARHPIRYYLVLPARRAASLWFDTHSQFYPFEGELFPFSNHDVRQRFWLPLFSVLTLIYTFLGIVGAWFLWQRRELETRKWVLLAGLMIFLRIGFFATLENPEPRSVVEVFPFLAILGGIAVTRLIPRLTNRLPTPLLK